MSETPLLEVKDLKKYFSESNPNGAYGKIREYLEKREFSHEQYSGYHSKYKTTDLEIFDLIRDKTRKKYRVKAVTSTEVAVL